MLVLKFDRLFFSFHAMVYRHVTNFTRSLDLARPVTMVLAQSYASDLAASGIFQYSHSK